MWMCDSIDGGIQTISIREGVSACVCAYGCIYVYGYGLTMSIHIRMCMYGGRGIFA